MTSSSPSNSNGGENHSNIYVKNLADHVNDSGLHQLFEQFGPIKTSCVMLDPATKRSRNFGFVKFENRESAQAAVQQMNNVDIQGRKLLVKFADADAENKAAAHATPSDNLYVKGLPQTLSEEEVHALFSTYGNVTQLKVLSRVGMGSTGEALVRMADVEQAAWALRNLNNCVSDGAGAVMHVRYADTPEDKLVRRRTAGRKTQRFQYTHTPPAGDAYPMLSMQGMAPNLQRAPGAMSDPCNLYVNELPVDADELFLYRTFAPFGAISSVRVMRDDKGVNRGFGFVKFVNAQEAYIALAQVDGKAVQGGKSLHVSPKTSGSKNPSTPP